MIQITGGIPYVHILGEKGTSHVVEKKGVTELDPDKYSFNCQWKSAADQPYTKAWCTIDGVCTGNITLNAGDYKTLTVVKEQC